MGRLLAKSGFRHLYKHPLQVVLTILGVTLGVAVIVAIDLANESASAAFKISMDEVTGKATHHIISPSGNIPDSVYAKLRIEYGLRKSAPVIEQTVSVIGIEGRAFTLLGIDPFAEDNFRSHIYKLEGGNNELIAGRNYSAALSAKTKSELGININDSFIISAGGKKDTLSLATYFKKSANSLSFDNIIITDIAIARKITGFHGLSRIDLILNDDELQFLENELRKKFPALQLSSSEAKKGISSQMTDAFELNLGAMSLLALIVGMFLIYNTMTFSVVQRREYLGLLRSTGVTGREIFSTIMNEAAVFAFIGIVLGIIAGVLLGTQLVKMVSRTINDLYFTVNVSEIYISPLSLIKGAFVGLTATFIAAAKPALEAARSSAARVLNRSEQERLSTKSLYKFVIIALIMAAVGAVILLLPSKSIMSGFIGFIPLIAAFTLITPALVVLIIFLIKPLARSSFGMIGAMSAKGIVERLSRTGIAIAALSVAVSAVVGVGTMVAGFRTTVVHWLEMRLSADIYISAPSLISSNNVNPLEQELKSKINALEGVSDTDGYRRIELDYKGRRINVMAGEMKEQSKSKFLFTGGDKDEIWELLKSGKDKVVVSEVFAYKNDLQNGSTFKMPTVNGVKTFEVVGIYYDYSTDVGLVSIYRPWFLEHFRDSSYSGIAAYIKDGYNQEELMREIENITKDERDLMVRSNTELLDNSVMIFDRTFLITNVLQILAVIVAFIGILSTLISLQLERRREAGVLRALGFTPGNIRFHIILQTAITGLIAGILSLPLGNLLAVVLIYIINKRSFGWTLQYELLPDLQIQALLVSIIAAVLAGLYPAYKMSKVKVSEALKSE